MPHPPNAAHEFIARWKDSGAAERANFQLFLRELCDVLGVEPPQPARDDDTQNAYVFERAVTFHNPDGTTSTGRIDLYKRGCFVLEAKQGSDRPAAEATLFGDAPAKTVKGRLRKGTAVRGTRGWDLAMQGARGQAEGYVRALPPSEGNPPFVVVVDVGHTFELYSDFSRAGKTYVPFPDARTHRFRLEELDREDVRGRLRLIWTEPGALDPSRRSARVTRGVAEQLAVLALSLEEAGYAAERVANFLMRAIFTMFAEDVRLIPAGSFTEALADVKREGVKLFPDMIGSLWATMNTGGFMEQAASIRKYGEDLDEHRKQRQAQHPALTITEMYNVLEKLRRGETLSERERVTHEQGLVSVLRQIHDDLDAAVFEAYGWPASLSDEEILERLVRLNAERAAEERAGLVRWLRPEFQRPAAGVAASFGEEFNTAAPAAAKQQRQPWPKSLHEQARAVRQALAAGRGVVTPQQLARAFTRARVERVEELLRTLVSLGQAREVSEGRYAP